MYLNPKNIVVDFLRSKIPDPRNRATQNTETFTSVLDQDFIQLTAPSNSVDYIETLEIDGTELTKWKDYAPDFDKQGIKLFTPLAAGLSIEVTYWYGKGWIFPDKPYLKLNAESFPRISVMMLSSPTMRLGNYEAPTESVMMLQIDIWVKEKQDGQVFEIDGIYYSGEKLADIIGYTITNAFEDFEESLFPVLYGFQASSYPIDLPYDEDLQTYHKSITIELRGLNIGRIEV